jgi:hypothetical protein
MLLLYLITPLLGTLKNYVKYKQLKPLLFIRTPITYFMIHLFLRQNNPWKIITFERWLFFIYKSFLSIYNDDYNIKKQKYIKKYNLKY